MIELLAPAKDKLYAKAAIDYGADAVYIGASEFGARKKASNSLTDIKEIVEYAHKFNVRIYVTINTILTDNEIIKANELVNNLYKIGVDAIIIQDMGLITLLRGTKFVNPTDSSIHRTPEHPDFYGSQGSPRTKASNLDHCIIPLYASTQCDNRTPEKVKFLESAGFSRVILARELSIEQIKEIKKQTNIELETFIHGALCVSYSGQCYLSYLIGGGVNGGASSRSANRGECAQPCRKKYSLVDENGNTVAKDKYLLCLKDFNASKYIKELVEAGITSFKIEGRLKDINYVKNVVAYYRKLIDNLGLKKTSSGKILFDFEPDLEKSFNRGFTDYFLKKRGDCYSFLTPKSRGEYVGKVKKIGKDYFEIAYTSLRDVDFGIENNNVCTKQSLHLFPQDGLCFFNNEELAGCLVNKVDGSKIYPNNMNGIKDGIDIYRNFDSEFEKRLENSKTCRKIGVNIHFDLNKIKALDEDGNLAEVEYDFKEFAQNVEKMEVNIINQLKKSGESDFWVEWVNVLIDRLPFLPISKINKLRRELLEKLMNERLKNYVPLTPSLSPARSEGSYPQLRIDYHGNVLNKYAREFYEKHGCKVLEGALECAVLTAHSSAPKCGKKCAMITKHCLKYAFNMCKSPQKLYLMDEKGKRYELKFNCDKCEMEIYF